jgi:periplasmic divalent cation tolerance protein
MEDGSMTGIVLLYMTAPDLTTAGKIARTLLAERLIACANLLPGATALYWWEGTIEEAGEVVVIAKSTAERVDAVTARVKQLHPYSCPCVVALPVDGGNEAFLAWVRAETTARSW